MPGAMLGAPGAFAKLDAELSLSIRNMMCAGKRVEGWSLLLTMPIVLVLSIADCLVGRLAFLATVSLFHYNAHMSLREQKQFRWQLQKWMALVDISAARYVEQQRHSKKTIPRRK